MGRPKSFREKVLAHVQSISAKSRFTWLVAENRERFGLSSAEAELLAQRADRFLVATASGPADEQVVVELPARDCHRRGHSTGTVAVVLSLFTHDDLMLYQRDGLEGLQNARLIRFIMEISFPSPYLPISHYLPGVIWVFSNSFQKNPPLQVMRGGRCPIITKKH